MGVISESVLIVAMLIALSAFSVSALDTNNKVASNIIQILPNDAMNRDHPPSSMAANKEKDLKTDSTITHPSEPAPEFYRGVSAASDSLSNRAYENRYGTTPDYPPKGSWLSLDKDALYRNPYIANAYNKLTGGGGATATPSVSSLMAPNASYKDRYDPYNHPSANDYLNSKYTGSSYGSSNYGSYGAPYGPAQALDYNGYGGSSSGFDSIYGTRPSYGQNSILSDNNYGYNGGYNSGGHHGYHGGDFLSSKFSKSSLLPLAGAALLGVAATLVANPLLLNFAGAGVGKRKRRSIDSNEHLKAKFDGQELAYRGSRV